MVAGLAVDSDGYCSVAIMTLIEEARAFRKWGSLDYRAHT